jgi:hypothetical protein
MQWITLINFGYVDFTKNFIRSMEKAAVNFVLRIYCIDDEAITALTGFSDKCECRKADFLDKLRLPSEWKVWMHHRDSKEEMRAALDYRRITMSKLNVISHELRTTNDVVGYIDMDIVLFSDPTSIILDVMDQHPDVDIFAQCDEPGSHCTSSLCHNFCTGVVIFRPHILKTDLFSYTSRDVVTLTGDQEFLNRQVKVHGVQVKTLDRQVFPNGCVFPLLRAVPVDFSGACLVHFNWMVGKEKIAAMKLQNVWF